jgi:hypothetical protein
VTGVFKKKAQWDKPFSEKVAKRVKKIPTGELEMWVEQSTYELGRCMGIYSRNRDLVALEEALTGAEALHAVVTELHSRASRTIV